MTTKYSLHKSITRVALVTGVLLLIPLTAKFITDEMQWSVGDFIFAGILIFSTGFAYTLLSAQSRNLIYRIAAGLALFTALFLVWSNLAVGLIGSEDNPENAMYFGVILVLIISSFLSRFRPKGMAYALFVTAAAQASTILIALLLGMQHFPGSSAYEIILVNGFFITLFCISGGLFWQISEEDEKSESVTEDQK